MRRSGASGWLPIFYRSDRGVDSESARSRFAMACFLTGPNCANAGAPSQQEIKAARVRLGSTHSYRRIRPASESADWPVDREASGRLCHLMKRGAFPRWQKLFVPTCPFQVGTKSVLPSSPCCDCQHYALHATQPCESCSRPARGFVYKKGLHNSGAPGGVHDTSDRRQGVDQHHPRLHAIAQL